MDREPDISVRPQAHRIELGDAIERVVAATVRVARAIVQLVQFSEHGAPSVGAQRGHQLGHGGDLLLAEQCVEGFYVELCGSHYGIITLIECVMVP